MGYFSDPSCNRADSQETKACEKYYNVLRALGRASFGCIYILDVDKGKIEFISQNPYLFSGLPSKEVEKLGYKFFCKYTRPEDIEILRRVSTAGFKFYENFTQEEKVLHTLSYDFHVKNANNVDVLVNHKITPVELSATGDISIVVCFVSYSLNRTAGNISIASSTSDVYWKYSMVSDSWSEEHKIKLKEREIEIIRLYLQGLKIEEIARQLFVSSNTIKFHRSKLFEKLGVNNITEALSYIVANNLI